MKSAIRSQKQRMITSISTQNTAADCHFNSTPDSSHGKRIHRPERWGQMIASEMPQITRASFTCLHRYFAADGITSVLCTQAI